MHKVLEKIAERQKAARQALRESAGPSALDVPESSSSDSEEEWDIEHCLGERIPRPKWCASVLWSDAARCTHPVRLRAEGDPTQQSRLEVEAEAPGGKRAEKGKRGDSLAALAKAAKAAK